MLCFFNRAIKTNGTQLFTARTMISTAVKEPKSNENPTFKCITLVALSNPEPGYKNTRHNAGRLLVTKMIDEIKSANDVKPSLGCMKVMGNVNLLPGKKLTATLDKIYGPENIKKYSVVMESFRGSFKKVHYQIFTPSLKRLDGTEDQKTQLYANKKVSFVLAYVDGTAMNVNGPKVIDFFENLPKILQENTPHTDVSDKNLTNFVVADDKDVKLGSVQIRTQFSSNRGHNGFHSCQKSAIKNKNITYNKLSIGISKPPVDETEIYDRMVLVDYVLGMFKPEEIELLKTVSTEKVWEVLLKERNAY